MGIQGQGEPKPGLDAEEVRTEGLGAAQWLEHLTAREKVAGSPPPLSYVSLWIKASAK